MERHSIAIVGLGRVGSAFLKRILAMQRPGVTIAAVCDRVETPGVLLARENNVPVLTLDQLVDLGDEVDLLFELTGDPAVKFDLRNRYFNSRNTHTVILPETVARLIWSLIGDGELPDVHPRQAY